MTTDHVATASITVDADADTVWQALTDPAIVKQYMFGTEVHSAFEVGAPITWAGQWEGEPYEDRGQVLEAKPGQSLQVTHFSPLTGEEDVPENYHTLTYTLQDNGHRTLLTLTQDGNATPEAQAHSEQNWQSMLDGLKSVVEARS